MPILKTSPSRTAARLLPLAAAVALLTTVPAHADTGKLLLTGGVSSVEGAAGGGISPWAVIGSQATEGEVGVSAYASRAVTRDYGLTAYGVAVGIHDRVELSLGHQNFDTGVTGTALGLPGLRLKQDIVGAKVRVAGDAVLDSDSLMPQIAVGVQFKRLQSSGLDGTLTALGAKRSGTDVYVSATKLFLAQGILVNGTLRATKANQGGLLGFGATLGGADNSYELQPEFSVAWPMPWPLIRVVPSSSALLCKGAGASSQLPLAVTLAARPLPLSNVFSPSCTPNSPLRVGARLPCTMAGSSGRLMPAI